MFLRRVLLFLPDGVDALLLPFLRFPLRRPLPPVDPRLALCARLRDEDGDDSGVGVAVGGRSWEDGDSRTDRRAG